jgi:hypothetical protein
MKLGLDQVVLQGMEGSGKNTMSKDEMDKLLKNGAYDIFKEGSGEKESNDFVSQDIDSILANRTTTIIHDTAVGPSTSPITSPSASPIQSPSASPITSPTASPSASPSTSPTLHACQAQKVKLVSDTSTTQPHLMTEDEEERAASNPKI